MFLETAFRMDMARVCPTGFGTSFAAVFVLIYRLRENFLCLQSLIALNRGVVKAIDAIVLQNLSLFF